MTLAWHDIHTLDPRQFEAYEEALCARAQAGEAVLGFSRLSRCALMGAFEDPRRALRLSYIRDRFPIVRRRTGGGSLSLDPGTLILVLAFPSPRNNIKPLAELMASLCAPLLQALSQYGLCARFDAPNDMTVEDRKIGSGFLLRDGDVIVFEAALALSLDIEELLKTLRLPLEKLSAAGILAARDRFAPLNAHLPDLRTAALHSTIALHLAQALGLSPQRERPPCPKTRSPMVFTEDCVPDVSAFLKTPGGVVYIDVCLDGTMVRRARFTGSIHCANPKTWARLSDSLQGSDITRLGLTLDRVLEGSPDMIGIDRADIVYLGHLCASRHAISQHLDFSAARQITIFSLDRTIAAQDILAAAEVVLLPYCAKPSWCKWRHRDGCPECGFCAVGEAYHLARQRGLQVVTITAYEHLCTVLADMKRRKVSAFLGVCCTDFFLKRDYAFVDAGIPALFIDIGGDTCYTLRLEEAAYAGRFEAEASLDARLFANVLQWRDRLKADRDVEVGRASGLNGVL